MKYTVMKMDKRFTHHDLFEYCIKFSDSMSRGQGPLEFNHAIRWFTETYGWSAEMRQYAKILQWIDTSYKLNFSKNIGPNSSMLLESPECCNPHWSWTNGYEDLRVYVKSSAELNFFQLRWANEQT